MSGPVSVVGAGSWGTAVAAVLAHRAPTVLWARSPELAAAINDTHQNEPYLAGIALPVDLRATAELAEVAADVAIVLVAVPSHGFRAVLEQLAPHLSPDVAVVSLTKGIESSTNRRMSEIVGQVLPSNPVGVLTGPEPRPRDSRGSTGGQRGRARRPEPRRGWPRRRYTAPPTACTRATTSSGARSPAR